MTKDKYIYIVFSKTCSKMGKCIRFVTRNQYNHVSLSFSPELEIMYSFARYNINSPFVGGFVLETQQRYFACNKPVEIKICKVPVSAERYIVIKHTIETFCAKKDEMIYNSLNAVLSVFHKEYKLENAYTCIEFAAFVLEMKGICSIEDMEQQLKETVIYEGIWILNEQKKKDGSKEFDDYFTLKSKRQICAQTAVHFYRIAKRGIRA